jgi:hypothetical protein
MNISRLFRISVSSISLVAALGATLAACGASDEGELGQSSPAGDNTCLAAPCDGELLDSGVGSGTQTACGFVAADAAPVTPTVVLLVDQSGSMTDAYEGGSRWDVLYGSLMSDGGVVKALDQDVRFGLALYTSDNGDLDGEQCPLVTQIDPKLDNHADIDSAYAAASPYKDTPTGEALAQVAQSLYQLDVDGPKIIIVATDGEPDTCALPNPQQGQEVAIEAAEDAYRMGIQTYVLGVGDDVGEDHLADMANAGAGLAVDGEQQAPYFKPTNQSEMVDTFGAIVRGSQSCVLPIEGDLEGVELTGGEVYLDGVELTRGDHQNGWTTLGGAYLVLLGEACDTMSEGEHEVTGSFFCAAPAGEIN